MKTLPLRLFGMLAGFSLAFLVTGYSEETSKERAPSKEALEKYDADGDGKLNEEEKAKRQADINAKAAQTRKENLDKYDVDGDGKLSKEEREAKKAAEAAEKAAAKAEREAKKAEKKAK
jgi:Ca2+-binding EF-hand superfamily protein